MANLNRTLIIAGLCSLTTALLHLLIIIGGSEWYGFFGAGETIVELSRQDSIYPGVITLVIALVFFGWALYAFSAAGVLRRLPWLKPVLVIITLIYLLRGIGLLPMLLISPGQVDNFLIISSIISFLIGSLHLAGIRQMGRTLQ
ncbi:MAG: hypothetical protein N0C81_12230 [Candidatus Thiodiazotropha lotti]|nr:hypothetical protein [Candidatus Thiodiazotropha lotti]MCG8002549.1 hypothetical protein [Candidatus Thiodiazotropha lotti]MCG8008398.1 hypothetical protein [Candidatus Thiodiazotropha lotti]MCW4186169.1 hypothetical protein [Candidatus Thiodiazotropha lotti]MCW4195987.1 hypothetical protein [Candidatus Thiodiazotropha lotti]